MKKNAAQLRQEQFVPSILSGLLRRALQGLPRLSGRPSRPEPARDKPYALEAIDPRLLLSVSLDANTGVLTGALTGANETVMLTQTGLADDGGIIIDFKLGGTTTTYGTQAKGVQHIDLDAGGGDDSIVLGSALPADFLTLLGGTGTDTLTGPGAATAWTLSGAGSGAASGILSFASIERITGGAGDDSFALQAGGSVALIQGGDGNDSLAAAGGSNLWTINGGGSTSNTVNAQAFQGIERLQGGSGADSYRINAGSAYGLEIDEAAGGLDALDFSATAVALTLDLSLVSAQTVASGGLSLRLAQGESIENLVGTAAADALTGNLLDNQIDAGAGDDVLAGAGGNDTYVFGAGWGRDRVTERDGGNLGEGRDQLRFGSTVTGALTLAVQYDADGNFRIADDPGANPGNSVLTQSVEDVLVTAGSGHTLDFSRYTGDQPLQVDLATGAATGFMQLSGFRNVVGSAGDDQIFGDANANILSGGAGNDSLAGRAGSDTLSGGSGIDRLRERQDADLTLSDTALVSSAGGSDVLSGFELATLTGGASGNVLNAAAFTGLRLASDTPLAWLNNARGVNVVPNDLVISLTDGTRVQVDLSAATTVGGVIAAINGANASAQLLASINAAGTGLRIGNAVGAPAGKAPVSATSSSVLVLELGLNPAAVGGVITGRGIAGGVTLDGGSQTYLDVLGSNGLAVSNANDLTLSTATSGPSATLLALLRNGDGVPMVAGADFEIVRTDGSTKLTIDLGAADTTLGHVIAKIRAAAGANSLFTVDLNGGGTALVLTDGRQGVQQLEVRALNGSGAAAALGILGLGAAPSPGGMAVQNNGAGTGSVLVGSNISDISSDLLVTLADGSRLDVDLSQANSFQDVVTALAAPTGA